jgi:hypothetical protein
VVSVVVPLMLAVLSYARGRGFDSRVDFYIQNRYTHFSTVYVSCHAAPGEHVVHGMDHFISLLLFLLASVFTTEKV